MVFLASNTFSIRRYALAFIGFFPSPPPILKDLSILISTLKYQGRRAPLMALPIPALPNRAGLTSCVYGRPDAPLACTLIPASANTSAPNHLGPVYCGPCPYR